LKLFFQKLKNIYKSYAESELIYIYRLERGKNMKVLIADDNIESLYFLDTLLTKSGYRTMTAENGAQALRRLKKHKFDAIITDILMPKMDGFQLCRECKSDKRLKEIPFLFYTATYRRKEDEEFALSLGAERFIIKPQEPEILLKILSDAIEEHKKKEHKIGLKEPVKEEIYLAEHNKRIIKKLEDKVISLDKEITRRKETEDKLFERIKELDCLYSVSNLAIRQDVSLEKIFKETVKQISEGMKYPELVCSRIIFDKEVFKTDNFKETKWKESRDIKVEGVKKGVMEVYVIKKRPAILKNQFLKEEKKLINAVSEILGVYIERKVAREKLEESYHKISTILDCIISTLAYIVEAGDPYTSGHQKKVAILATAIAREMGMDKNKIDAINTAALIHDIGKIKIPASILSKPGKLSDIEFEMIKIHPQVGYDILKNIEFPYPIAEIVVQHHEKLNGSGYPYGLKSKDIKIEAKVIAVADAMEAMISNRPYRPALGIDKAIKEITDGKGKFYDPKIADVCIKLIRKKSFRDALEKDQNY
jgi:putative nucleotidyltransferase with HDIG domain